MSMDFSKSLKATFCGEGWFLKLIIGGILFCIPIVNFIVFGYFVKYLKNVVDGKDSLPEFSDIGKLFVTGLKFIIGGILLFIPLILLVLIFSFLFSKNAMLSMAINALLEIAYTLLSLLMIANFSIDEKILSMVDFQRAFLLLKENSNIGSFILYLVAIYVVSIIITVICAVTMVGLILVPFVMYAVTLMLYNLLGQFTQNAPKLAEVKTAASV